MACPGGTLKLMQGIRYVPGNMGWDPGTDCVSPAQVTARDDDLGANGSVRYSARARGAARGLLRVHSTTGRLYASPRLALAPGDSYDVTVSSSSLNLL